MASQFNFNQHGFKRAANSQEELAAFNSVDYSNTKMLSARTYNIMVSALIFIGFCVMAIGYYICQTAAFRQMLAHLNVGSIAALIVTFLLTIVGTVMTRHATETQNVGLGVAGYIIFIVTFGFFASFALSYYSLPTIETAFVITAAITLVAGVLGMLFPSIFQKLVGPAFVMILATVVVEIVLLFVFHIHQTITDYVVILGFAVFIARDLYTSTQCEPTVNNAILMACNLFSDIVNVLLRVAELLDNSNR